MDKKNDHSPKKRVNISITEETHNLLKAQAERENTTMSQLITDWVWNEEIVSGPFRINREWVKELDTETLERLYLFSYENHTTSAQAIRDWVWSRKVKGQTIPGQLGWEDLK